MKLDFIVDADPNRAGYTEITVGGRPAWIQTVRGGDASAPDMPSEDMGFSVYVQGPEYWYQLVLYCRPPTGADADGQVAYHAQCEATFNQILDRFQVIPP
jgi:hypothetical protein